MSMDRIKDRLGSRRQSLKYWLQRPFNSSGSECKSAAAHDIPTHAQPVQAGISVPEPEPEPEAEQEPEPKSPQSIWNSPLECLPAEIRHHILSSTGYEGLKNLVRASPVYHQQYLRDREHILYGCLERSLGSSTIDACAVYESGLFDFAKARNHEKINQFLESYKGHRCPSHYLKSFTFDQIISMARFHSVVGDIARNYTSWALANLAEITVQHSHGSSRTEEARIVRGLYRFELYCNLYGSSNHKTNSHLPLDFEGWEVLRMFMSNYKPWEVEEIACIYTFVNVKFNQGFDDIYSDVHPDNPRFKFRRWLVPPDGSFDFDWQEKRHSLLEGTITRGLHLLHHVLFRVQNHEHLVSTMQKEISNPQSNFFRTVLAEKTQSIRRDYYPSDQDLKEQRRDPLPFQGDDDDLPPLTWTTIWQGTYSNLFGWYIRHPMRLWGYIMWDAARIEGTGARELLIQQWRRYWKYHNPRDGDSV